MNHEADERWLDHLDGNLSPRERARIEAQLAEDPALREWLEALRTDHERLAGLPAASWPPERAAVLARAVLERARAESRAPVFGKATASRLRRLRPWLAAAALLAVAWPLARWSFSRGDAVPSAPTAEAPLAALPELLRDPELLENFDVIRDLDDLEAVAEVLDLEDDTVLFDMVGLELLSGA